MDRLLQNGWFYEKNDLWPGQCFGLEVTEVLHTETSKYQQIDVLQTKEYGKVLVLDGIIQCSERDEFAYQEMISMVPLCAHPNPSKVLIVGGGDGGVARDVSKHPLVTEIHQVEIDERVIAVSKRYFPHMSAGFHSHKMHLHIGDGFEVLRSHDNAFDVIITDSSDPVGPNASLYQADYFHLLRQALRPGGLICSQAGAAWLDLNHVTQMQMACRKHFPIAKYGLISVPTYPTGQIGFLIGAERDPSEPEHEFTEEQCEEFGLRYYDAQVHRASFVLPRFIRKQLNS